MLKKVTAVVGHEAANKYHNEPKAVITNYVRDEDDVPTIKVEEEGTLGADQEVPF